jgi:8-oxo-dGTP pyrophosphatase MutT (NUDIX family)
MTKDNFLQRFQLYQLSQPSNNDYDQHKFKSAAVLIGLTEIENSLNILFTKRAQHLKHHAGQISFPGGKVEPFDHSIIATAIRETQEEIGIEADAINVLGQLHPYYTISGYIVTPIVAFIKADQRYVIDDNEVAEIFHAPLTHFLNTNNHHAISIYRQGRKQKINFMPYQHYNIWGATAAMLKDLAYHLN